MLTRRNALIAGTLIGIALGWLLTGPLVLSNLSAQESTSLGFDVMWVMEEGGASGESCQWVSSTTLGSAQDTGIVQTGFPGTVTIAGADGTIRYSQQLVGEFVDDLSCHMEISATVDSSAAYTIEINGQYVATLPESGGLGEGNNRPIVSLVD